MGTTARHRNQTQQPDRRRWRWWPLGLTVTVVGGIGTLIAVAPTVQDRVPSPDSPSAVFGCRAALPGSSEDTGILGLPNRTRQAWNHDRTTHCRCGRPFGV